MRSKYYLGGLAVVVGAGVVILGLRWYGGSFEKLTPVEEMYRARMKTQREHLSDTAKVAALPERQVVRLAIGSLGLPEDNQNGQLTDLVIAELSNTKGLELVERRSLDKVLTELQMNLCGLVRAGDAVRVGKLVRADWFLLGTRATIAGTNSIVMRVVDARTGILRDAGIVTRDQAQPELASEVARFVGQSRRTASSGKQSVYLAIGSFEDLSINSRQADFSRELRGYLTGAFRGGSVTLLEREYIETLLQEVYLDLAGLTEGSGAQPATPMQSAFWLITGDYQSYETTNLQVEVELQLAPMFGRIKNVHLVGEPGEPLNRKIKAVIDQGISQPELSNIPTRRTEVSLLMDHGRELAGINLAFGGQDLVYLGQAISTPLDEQAALRKRRNTLEALRAFQTILLLEPTNQEAKLYLAACLRNNTIQRAEEARQYYRQVIERPVNDKWSDLARQALVASFEWGEDQGKAAWFETVAGQTSSPDAAEFYRRQAEAAKTEVLAKSTGQAAQTVAEARLLANMTNALLGSGAGPMGVEEFVKTYGTNRAAAAQRLSELYPNWGSQAPQIASYLLAAVVSGQVDTNAPLVLEFQQLLEQLAQHPDQVFKPHDFWWHTQIGISEWCWAHKDYRLMTRFMEAKTAASVAFAPSQTNWISAVEITDQDKMSLAIAYLGTHEWDKALPLLQGFAGQPLSMSLRGPWGDGGTVLLPNQLEEYCGKKMGLPVVSKKGEFQLGKPVLQLCRDQAFAMDDGGFWTAMDNRLLHLDFELNTNLVLELPLQNGSRVTAICLATTNLWIGTDGDGLLEYDKVSRQFHHLRERDGLLMDKIASLYLYREELWVGYGLNVREAGPLAEGGLGKVDLTDWKSTSFVPSLSNNLNAPPGGAPMRPAGDAPTRSLVRAITQGITGEIWFLAQGQTPLLCRYRTGEKTWNMGIYPGCTCLARDSEHLLVGRYWNYYGQEKTGALGVSVLDLSSTNSTWRDFKGPDGIPPGRVTALTTEGRKLWVGGFGYIAAIDLASQELEAVAHVQAETVDRLQTGGGFLWAQLNCGLYRVPLASLR